MKARGFFIPSIYLALWWGRLQARRREQPPDDGQKLSKRGQTASELEQDSPMSTEKRPDS
jgi:hypothetical protein